jgi:hypothetical protein
MGRESGACPSGCARDTQARHTSALGPAARDRFRTAPSSTDSRARRAHLTRRRTLPLPRCTCRCLSPGPARGSAGKTAGPIVAVATHGVQLPAVNADTSNRKLQGGAPRRLNDGTRCRAPCRGIHVGDSTTAVSPSIVTRAESMDRRHAGGTTLAIADELKPETAANRSVRTIRKASQSASESATFVESVDESCSPTASPY